MTTTAPAATPPKPKKKARNADPGASQPRHRPDPWERLDDESTPAWAAFQTYRDLGAARSLVKVQQRLGKSGTLIAGWSTRNSWVMRAAAYDSHLDREWLKDQRDMRRNAARRNARAGALAMQKFAEYVVNLDPSKVKPGDMARLAEVASKIERAALGETDGRGAHLLPDNGGVDAATINGMSDEERHTRLRMLVREAEGRLENPDAVHDGLHEEDEDD